MMAHPIKNSTREHEALRYSFLIERPVFRTQKAQKEAGIYDLRNRFCQRRIQTVDRVDSTLSEIRPTTTFATQTCG
jgi:hypothetical protein